MSDFEAPYDVRRRENALRGETEEEPGLQPREILHLLRSEDEGNHRHALFDEEIFRRYIKEFHLDHDAGIINHSAALSFWNKTIPIYILNSKIERRYGYIPKILLALQNYLYKKWHRPYRNEIDLGQFLARMIEVNYSGGEEYREYKSVVGPILNLHRSICMELDHTHGVVRVINECPCTDTCLGGCRGCREYERTYDPSMRRGYREDRRYPSHLTLPIFKAMVLVIGEEAYQTCHQLRQIHRIPVAIILTGHTRGLSNPISLTGFAGHQVVGGKDIARTTLEQAIEFVIELQQREEQIRGIQPDPIKTSKTNAGTLFYPRALGWPSEKPLIGPSSSWVDLNEFPTWTGFGKKADASFREMEHRLIHDHDCLDGDCRVGRAYKNMGTGELHRIIYARRARL